MRIVVTGKSGQVARALNHVNNGRHELIFTGRPEADLERPDTLRAPIVAARPDLILSCAAFTQVDACETAPDRARIVNGEAPGELARIAHDLGIPILHLSTDYVFDGQLRRPYREDDAPHPLSVYGASKLAGEVAVAAATPRHINLRVSWVYSQFSDNFLGAMLKLAQTRDTLNIVDDQVSCPTPALELADTLLDLAGRVPDAGPDGYGVFHLAGADPVDRATLARAIMDWARAHNLPAAEVHGVPSSDFPTPAPRPHYSALDCQKINAIYGIHLPSWRTWLGPCLEAIAATR